jgi:CDGSH-type Zn-finger protein
MADVTISMRPNGPFLVEGSVQLVDSDGQPFPGVADKTMIALCRCGASAKRPFCDGTHSRCGFESDEKAPAE